MHPAIAEAVILGFMAVSGVSLAALLGFRRAVPLVIVALSISVVTRLLTAFAAWSLNLHGLAFELWVGTGVIATVLAAVVRRKWWRSMANGVVILGFLSATALATKYLFDVGERQHSDSASVLSISLLVIQAEEADTSALAGHIKRGIAYPLMLALGPEGRILSAFTPLLYLVILLAVAWFAHQSLRGRVAPRYLALAVAGIGAFSLSVPMFRAAMFYLNAHTLMSFGLLLMVGGLLRARRRNTFDSLSTWLVSLGGIIGVTSRAEGIVLVLIVVAAVAGSSRTWSPTERLRLFGSVALIGLTLSWWWISLEIRLAEDLGISSGWLIVMSVLGAAILSQRFIDPFRRWFLPVSAVVIFGWLAWYSWSIDSPFILAQSQWPNLGLGAGGWGTAAHLFIGSAVILGFTVQSRDYRLLLGLTVVTIGGILFSKAFGSGGLGREGFDDSVNRMWLHLMPLIILTSLIGYSELLSRALRKKKRETPRSLSSV